MRCDSFSHVAPMLIAKLAPRFLNSSYRSSVIYTSGVVGDKPVKGYIIGSYRAAGLFGFTRALGTYPSKRRQSRGHGDGDVGRWVAPS